MLEGGDSGPALMKGDLNESFLVEQIDTGAMPPGKAPKLSEAEITTIKSWITAEAPSDSLTTAGSDNEPQHWAFQPPQRSEVSRPTHLDRTSNPIGAFSRPGSPKKNWILNYAPTNRLTLSRRVTLGL